MKTIAEIMFWASAGIMLYVYVGYPAFLSVVALFCRKQRPKPDYYPMLSVLIPAHNEEADIGRKIEETLQLEYPPDRFEIVVVSDASTDRTDAIVKSLQNPRVRFLRIENRRGKTHAQNEGVKACRGEIVVFSDATTTYYPLALRYLAANYRDPRVGAVSGCYQYFDHGGDSPTGVGSIAFWNYENRIKTLQSQAQTITGCCGCIYSVRRDLYVPLGDDVVSDLVQPLWVIKKGYRVAFEDRALAYEETTESIAHEFSMRVRVVTGAIRGLLSVKDLLNPFRSGWVAFQLLSHKVLRWLVPVLLMMLLASSAVLASHGAVFRILFWAQALFYLVAAVTALSPRFWSGRLLSLPLYFCTLNAAALISFIEVLRGREYVTWEPVRR